MLIVASKKDEAGMNIKEELEKLGTRVFVLDEEIVYTKNIKTKNTKNDIIIFASKHASKEKRKTLTLHFPGNWGKAEMGGKDKQLCIAPAFLLKEAFIDIKKEVEKTKIPYEVSLECTHHGPFCENPCFFVEIGGTKEEWNDKKAAEIVARTISKIGQKQKQNEQEEQEKEQEKKWKVGIGLGGGHYCPAFNKIETEEYALSHICPKYALPFLDEEMLRQAIAKTAEKVDCILLDWKGLGKEKQRIIEIIKKTNLKYEKI